MWSLLLDYDCSAAGEDRAGQSHARQPAAWLTAASCRAVACGTARGSRHNKMGLAGALRRAIRSARSEGQAGEAVRT